VDYVLTYSQRFRPTPVGALNCCTTNPTLVGLNAAVSLNNA